MRKLLIGLVVLSVVSLESISSPPDPPGTLPQARPPWLSVS
jgi:hypothetical protein